MTSHKSELNSAKTKSLRRRLLRCFHLAFGNSFRDYFASARRIVWIAAVGVCCYFMIKQMQECLDKLRNPPITTQTQIVNHDHMEYPAVTFCFKNSAGQGYDLRTLRYFNISDYWINFDSAHLYKSPWEGFDWGGTDLSTVWEYATYRFHNGYSDTSHPERPVGMPEELKVVQWGSSLNSNHDQIVSSHRFFHDHGLCQTYRPDRMAQEPMPGERRGYKFHFTYLPGVDNETYLLEDEEEHMLPGGMDLYIHDAEQWFTENPLQFTRGEHLYVHAGREVFIKLSEATYRNLDREEAPCLANPGEGYSFTECTEKCRWDYLAGQPDFRCDAPFMDVQVAKECPDFERALDLFEVYQEWYDPGSSAFCDGHCVQDCEQKLFQAQIIKEEETEDTQNSFHIYFPSGQTQVLTEEWGYDMTLFIADFGGSLGFLLGVSILSVLEIVEGITVSAYEMYRRSRRRKGRKEDRYDQDNEEDEVTGDDCYSYGGGGGGGCEIALVAGTTMRMRSNCSKGEEEEEEELVEEKMKPAAGNV